MQPKLTVSGFRGIWGQTLTEDIAREYVRAFSLFTQKHAATPSLRQTILVGRDGRESGATLLECVTRELLTAGFTVIDLGMMPTPTVLFLIGSEKADGAVIITASHNPIQYNGLKFVTAAGLFTTEAEVKEIESLREQTLPACPARTRTDGTHLFEKHLTKILENIDTEKIKEKKFTVALDPINSVGCTTSPQLFAALGATAEIINGEPTGKFAHEPEPLKKNLTSLQALVREKKCDVGFAQDPDGDRLVICDEYGEIPSEETMLALCIKAILSKTRGDIAVNMSTSNMCEDIASAFGVKTWRSKVGEANVVASMREHACVAGGEGSGGIIYPTINTARDSFVGIALILELMAQEEKPLSEIIAQLPKYFMVKDKIPFGGSTEALYTKLRSLFPKARETTTDGLRLDLENRSWIHIRPSNTEPIVRIITEAPTEAEAIDLSLKMR